MKAGFASSLLAHLMVVGFGVVSLSSPRPMTVADVEALPVDIIPIESITKTIQGEKDAELTEAPAPKPTTRPETVENAENVGDTSRDTKADAPKETKAPAVEKTEAPAPEPEPEIAEKPEQVPVPEPKPATEPKTDIAALTQELAEPEKTEETFEAPKRVTTPKRRPTRPKRDTAQKDKRKDKKTKDEIAALLNKEDASAGGAKRSTKKAGLGTKKGNNKVKMSQSEVDALRGQIQSCWNVGALAGRDDADKLRARVEFRLKPDGTLDGKPSVDASGGSKRSNRTFAGSARRAVIGCAPYQLPQDKYEDWADVVVNFSLKDML